MICTFCELDTAGNHAYNCPANIKKYYFANNAGTGWICPTCKTVYSPDTHKCFNCSPFIIVNTEFIGLELLLKANTPTCLDCGMAYDDFGMDTTLPNLQWRMIMGEDTGKILCANCMVKRAKAKIKGVLAARMVFEVLPDEI